MADTVTFFNGLGEKVSNGDFVSAEGFVYQFNIEGAGTWFIDLRDNNCVAEGTHESPDCTISTDKETFDSMLGNPMMAMQAFMTGKLVADNLGLATKLQAFLA